jgi:hypothetical protein
MRKGFVFCAIVLVIFIESLAGCSGTGSNIKTSSSNPVESGYIKIGLELFYNWDP